MGEDLWGSNSDAAHSIVQTSDGGFAVAGKNNSKSALLNADFWIFKLNALGTIVWDKTLGERYSDEAYSIVQTSDGGFAVAGYKALAGAKDNNFLVFKLDRNGDL